MRRHLSTVGGNAGNERKTPKQVTQHCVFALCRNMTVHHKGIEYRKDDRPWKVYVSGKCDNNSNNQPQVSQQNSLTEDDNDCTISNLQTQPDQGNISGWIAPNFDFKMDASNSEAGNTHLDSGNANEKPSACEPNDPALCINRRVTSDVINLLINRPCHPNPTNLRLCVGLR